MDVKAETDLVVEREGAAGIIRLNRPKALNALTLEMTREIAAALDVFENDPNIALIILEGAGERGLCAGGDIRGLYESARAKGDLGKIFWREEYIVNARIAKYPKPYVAFMDGFVMGGGVGLAGHASHRVVTEKTKVAMPEVSLGFFPDVGGTWLLSRAPGDLGTYFGLTGLTMNGADAVFSNLADVRIASSDWAALRATLTGLSSGADAASVMTVIKRFSAADGMGPVTLQRGLIDRAFAHDTIEEIFAALEQDGSEFAQSTLKAMRDKSPRGLKVTLKLLQLARASTSLEECLKREYLAALEVFDSHDFVEGVRAAIIDKDRNPKWQPPTIEEVTPEIVARYLARRDVALTF
ncbi:enoyl-CoA hydratase/isomerase family protein [Tardiphaga sp.]|uniref:enoyl-CoA hydratase/isomerase family protein n=1 Tax=Tardiphaga sp. TaxID=1926292 RepID=UPI00262D1706|nr:enoyl-CoA hydratase/isomerase family protein [Tardiphaga sp.]MDB5620102.1 Enoyl-CoA hydratase/isomerase [Tardiphaga sp.]